MPGTRLGMTALDLKRDLVERRAGGLAQLFTLRRWKRFGFEARGTAWMPGTRPGMTALD
jgi:hypothetical protein